MTLYRFLAAYDSGVDFLTMDEALDNKVLTVAERNESGSVPEIQVSNRSDHMVLMLDGEELVGASRTVCNVTVLVGPGSETVVPVSCVEQGRWSYRTREFHSGRRSMSPSMKRGKTESVTENLAQSRSFEADQRLVWEEVEAKHARMGTPLSPTMAMAHLFDSHATSTGEYLKAFHPVDNQIGMIVFIDGEMAGIELLCKFGAFQKIHKKLVESYVMDALETAPAASKVKKRASRTKVQALLHEAAAAHVQRRESVALGHDIRLESDELVGAGLECEGKILSMTLFQRAGDRGQPTSGSMGKASTRSRWVRQRFVTE